MTASIDREIGRLSAEVDSLKDQLTAVKKQLEDQAVVLREVRDVLVSSKGSWRLLLGVAGLAATLSGLVVSASQWWPWRG